MTKIIPLLFLAIIVTACSDNGKQKTQEDSTKDNQEREKTVQESLLTSELFDEEKTIQISAATNKPILLYFTTYLTKYGRRWEAQMTSDAEIKTMIEEKFIFRVLYCDDRQSLPASMQRKKIIGADTMQLKVHGDFHSYYQISSFKISGQPFFAVVDHNKKVKATATYNALNKVDFKSFLAKGLD